MPEEFEHYIRKCFTQIDEASCQEALEIIDALGNENYKILSDKIIRKINLIKQAKNGLDTPEVSEEEYELFKEYGPLRESIGFFEHGEGTRYIVNKDNYYSLQQCRVFPSNQAVCTKWIERMKETLWYCKKKHSTNKKICTPFARFVWKNIHDEIEEGFLKIKILKKKLIKENLYNDDE